MTCVPSEDSDQPTHPRSLISLRCALKEWEAKDPWFLHGEDQNRQIPRRIWVFPGRTGDWLGLSCCNSFVKYMIHLLTLRNLWSVIATHSVYPQMHLSYSVKIAWNIEYRKMFWSTNTVGLFALWSTHFSVYSFSDLSGYNWRNKVLTANILK